jgi:hypothetical protein
MRYELLLLMVLALPSIVSAQGARLGGTPDDFTQKWGQPFRNAGGAIYDYDKCPGRTAVGRWSIMVEEGRVTSVTRNACPGEVLDASESARQAATFAPADARRVRPFQTDDGWSAEERRSATLAKALPATVFKSCKGNAPPGTFSYMLSPERQSWMLALGTCL